MKSFLVIVSALFAISASAAPERRALADAEALRGVDSPSDMIARDDTGADGFYDGNYMNCLTASRAQQVASNFKALIVNYNATFANATLTSDYTDYSDSVNELFDGGCPTGPKTLGSATFTSRAAFEAAQSSQPTIPFQQLNIWHTCHAVIIRWASNMQPEVVTGIIVMETVPAPITSKYKDLIKLVFSEFNSGAWLYDLGIFKPSC